MMKPHFALKNIRRVTVREWNRIRRSTRTLFLIAVLPVLVLPFLVYIYSSGVLRDLPIGVYDGDHSELSRLMIRSIESTSAFRIVEYDQSVDEIRGGFRAGRLQAAFFFPPSLERDVKRGVPATVVLYNNASNLVVANTVLKEGATLIKTVSGGVVLKKVRSRGMLESTAMNIVNALRVQVHPLYNPNYNYMNFLIVGLIPLVLQMIVMVSSVTALNGEVADGTYSELLEAAGGSTLTLLAGKFVAHFLLHSATAIAIVAVLFPAFGLVAPAELFSSAVLLTSLVAASLAVALCISMIVRGRLLGTEVVLFLNMPAFLFSGFIYPFWAMPALHRAFAQVLPSTHFLYGFLKVFQMGEPLSAASPDLLKLLAFTVIGLVVAGALVRRYNVTLSRPHVGGPPREVVS
jgi:ABC-2 type transport system permease protein